MKELKFDHFKNINELLQHIDIWYKEDDIGYTRWFGLTDLYQLGKYINDLRQKNKKLKQILYDIEKEYDKKSLFAEDSILTELEEWLKEETIDLYDKDNPMLLDQSYITYATERKMAYMYILDKIQKLKEKYK